MSNTITKLPERWYIEITKENCDILNEWVHYYILHQFKYICYTKALCIDRPSVYTEITTEQFRDWVLGEQFKIDTQSAPKAVENYAAVHMTIPNTKHTSMCMLKAADDEPIFVLRAKDFTAPETIKRWIAYNTGTQPQEKLDAAKEIIEQMEDWYKKNVPAEEQQWFLAVEHSPHQVKPIENVESTLLPFDLQLAKSGNYDVVCDEPIENIYYATANIIMATMWGSACMWNRSGELIFSENKTLVPHRSRLFLKPKVKVRLVCLHEDGTVWTAHKDTTLDTFIKDSVDIGGDTSNNPVFIYSISTDGTHALVHDFKNK